MHAPTTLVAPLCADGSSRLLGEDPATGGPVWLRNGRYGWFLELQAPAAPVLEAGEAPARSAIAAAAEEQPGTGKKGRPGRRKKSDAAAAAKPKRAALGKSAGMPDIDLEQALQLLAWPKVLCETMHSCLPPVPHARSSNANVVLQVKSRCVAFGMRGTINHHVLMNVQELGPHPEDDQPVMAAAGQFGPYVSHAGINASLPKVGGTLRGQPGSRNVEQETAKHAVLCVEACMKKDGEKP